MNNSHHYAQVQIPQHNFGKVRAGQSVFLKLSAYPYQEFGALKGQLAFVSMIPSDSGFTGRVNLPAGMLTNQQKELHYQEGLTANAEIVTSDRKLSDRIFSSLRGLLDRK